MRLPLDFVERNGSANSLDKVLSFLRCGYTRSGLPWLLFAEEDVLKRIVKVWKEEHGREAERGVPITSRVLARWLSALPRIKADPTLLTAILRVGHAGMLRAGELCRRERQADPGYRVDDVHWAKTTGPSSSTSGLLSAIENKAATQSSSRTELP